MPEPVTDGYPIVVRLAGRPVVVIGGGTIALRKAAGLAAAGARVTVVAPDVVAGFDDLPGTHVVRRRYRRGDLEGAVLAIAATGDAEVQQQVFDDGEEIGVFVNSADDPERCSFILPAVARRGHVIVAVSTQGRSPALAGKLRDLLADALPEDLDEIVAAAERRRAEIRARGESTEDADWSDVLGR